MSEIVGLLIEFNRFTGERAGDISPRDPKLKCYGWQKLDSDPALEVRLIEDDRDIKQYEGIDGITILHGQKEIEDAIDSIQTDSYKIINETLFRMDMEEREIKLNEYKGKSQEYMLKDLKKRGVMGISGRSVDKSPIRLLKNKREKEGK